MTAKKSKGMAKMSVLDEFLEAPEDIYVNPEISQESLDKIREQTKAADLPIEQKIAKENDKANIIQVKETRNEPVIKDKQSTNKELTETRNEPVTDSLTRNKPVMETRNVKVIKDKQSTNKPVTETQGLSLDFITSFQRSILHVIFEEMQANPFDKETRPLNIQQLGQLLGISERVESLRIVILRLEKMGFLIKTKVKNGRSGWTCYTLPNQVFEQLLKESQNQKPVIKDKQSTNKPVTKPVMDDPSKKESNLIYNSYFLTSFPTLQKIGLKVEHLEKSPKTQEDVEQTLTHFEHSVLNNEIKSNLKLPVLLSILNSPDKQWVSESYLQQLSKDLEENAQRVNQAEAIKKQQAEVKLREKYQQFLEDRPDFISEVKKEQRFTSSDEILNQVAFEKWKELHDV